MTTRREFIGAGAALLAAARAGADSMLKPAERRLEVLVLGGTGFIGPHQVRALLDRGHAVTTFNRGRRSGMYGDRVEELSGDRDTRVGDGLAALVGDRRWDVVLDNSGYVPRHVRDSAELLVDRCAMYLYTSTVAVYDFEKAPTVDAAGPLLAAPEPATEEVTGETYGALKAECDRIVQDVCGEKASIVRPTYVVGPGDTTDRFTYWVERFHHGGDIVCPAYPEVEVQWIDARDLAALFT
ncbi:MAG: NAD-dependent epimerase/dehydratase family protein, partial [Woeseiaceae bacterium]|nr:NAD-dependent epimerase/dehydratase family protein [Woeseiaceae bacterium]